MQNPPQNFIEGEFETFDAENSGEIECFFGGLDPSNLRLFSPHGDPGVLDHAARVLRSDIQGACLHGAFP